MNSPAWDNVMEIFALMLGGVVIFSLVAFLAVKAARKRRAERHSEREMLKNAPWAGLAGTEDPSSHDHHGHHHHGHHHHHHGHHDGGHHSGSTDGGGHGGGSPGGSHH